MTANEKEPRRRPARRPTLPGLLILLFFLFLPAAATTQVVNAINTIKTVEAGVDVELTSPRGFPVRNELIVLRIGTREFTRSRSPEDGSLNTLIFTLTAEEFAATATGDRVVVQCGLDEVWDFGTLDKSRLDR